MHVVLLTAFKFADKVTRFSKRMDYSTKNIRISPSSISQIFASRHTPLRMPTPPTALEWVKVSNNTTCLVIGMQNGSIGLTWYTGYTSQHTTISHILSPITHLRASSANRQVAVGGYYGTLMVLKIGEAPAVENSMLTTVKAIKQTILGLDWSWDGTRLASLRVKSDKSNPISLMVYSNLTQRICNNIEVTFPRRIVGQAVRKEEQGLVSSQRIAWNQDDQSLFLTLTHDSLIQVCTLSWRIISTYNFNYSTLIHVVDSNQLIAVDTNKRIKLYNTTTDTLNELGRDVDNYIPFNGQFLAITNQSQKGRKLVLLNSKGDQLFRYKLPTTQRVTSLSISPDSSMLFYTTPTEICSLILYATPPMLKELCMSVIKEHSVSTRHLPAQLQMNTSMHHTVLLPSSEVGEETDLCVYKVEKKRKFGINKLSLVVKKHHLGQVLEVMRLTKYIGYNAKLIDTSSFGSVKEGKEMLSTLLPTDINTPARDTKIKWNSSKNKFTVQSHGDKIKLRFKDGLISVTGRIEQEFQFVETDGVISVQLKGNEILTIVKERHFFRVKQYKEYKTRLSHIQMIMIGLTIIIRF